MDNPLEQGYSSEEDEDFSSSDYIDEEIISKLSSLNDKKAYKSYAEIYSGGVYALRPKNRKDNEDWMSQSANSFREIFYCLQQKEGLETEELLNQHLSKTLVKKDVSEYRKYLSACYDFFTDITHHFVGVEDLTSKVYILSPVDTFIASELDDESYLRAVKIFKEHIKIFITTAIEIHEKIKTFIANNSRDVEAIKVLLESSYDARAYFFSRIDETWGTWLFENGFFAILKKKAEDPKVYSYHTPELEYLVRIAKLDPNLIERIISATKISEANFNPEIIDRFLWILGELPIENLERLTKKVKDEKWLYLMKDFQHSGYSHQRVVNKLTTSKKWTSLLEFGGALLEVKKEEDYKKDGDFYSDSPLYVKELSYSDIYKSISEIGDENLLGAINLISERIIKISNISKKSYESTFENEDGFVLHDQDIFKIKIKDDTGYSYRNDIHNIVAVYVNLIVRLFNVKSKDEFLEIYNTKISTLPDTRTLWRVKLFAMTRHPLEMKSEIKDALFRVFEAMDEEGSYYDIIGGAEYHRTLILGFSSLEEKDQREYVKNIFTHFTQPTEDKEADFYRKERAFEILFYISKSLIPEELEEIKKIFGKDFSSASYEPHSSVGESRGGVITHKSPVDLGQFTVPEIIEKLKTDYKIGVLNELYKNDDFLNPRGPEGLGEELKNDFKNRPEEYFSNFVSFFDREEIDSHYLYSIFRGIDEMMREPRRPIGEVGFNKTIDLFTSVVNSGKHEAFKEKDTKSWLAGWTATHRAMSDVLVNLLGGPDALTESFTARKKEILEILEYLMTTNKVNKEEDKEEEKRDLHGVAINSVDGRAFQALVELVHKEHKFITKESKALFEKILDGENSLGVWFLIGHNLAHFYYADGKWLKTLLPKIFDKTNKERYFAVWQGYVSGSLYKEFFDELQEEYKYVNDLKSEDYPTRKSSVDLDEALATHMALAYMHLGLKIEDELFKQFWESDEKRREEFISFIGRYALTRSQAGDQWFADNKVEKEKITSLWEWVIKENKIGLEGRMYSSFGSWINQEKEVVSYTKILELLPETLRRATEGDFWEYGLMRSLSKLAEVNPEQTLQVIKFYFLDKRENLKVQQHKLYELSEIVEALKIIYKSPDLKIKTRDLINLLITKGGRYFWALEEVLKTTD